MTSRSSSTQFQFSLTQNALAQFKKLQKAEEKTGYGVRLDVIPGGCAGFKYFMDFEQEADKEDVVVEQDSLRLFIRPESVEFLQGTELDYVQTLEKSGFQFNNPNVTHSCHCGKSVC